MQDQLTNSLQQPRADVQQGSSQQPQQSVTPDISGQVSPLLSEPAPSGQLQVQQSVGSPDTVVEPAGPVPGDGYGWSLALLIVPVLLVAWIFLPKAAEVIDDEEEPEIGPPKPQSKPVSTSKQKPTKKSKSRAKRKKR